MKTIGATSKHSTFLSKGNSNVECFDVTPDSRPADHGFREGTGEGRLRGLQVFDARNAHDGTTDEAFGDANLVQANADMNVVAPDQNHVVICNFVMRPIAEMDDERLEILGGQ